ncbi:MAG: FAD/NAD(P)-binding protein [Roseinatronobacter sp.]
MRDLPEISAARASAAPPVHLAIIGFGPRGLAAAEYALASDPARRIDLFDPSPWPAAGPNFAPDETPHCLLNLRAQEIDLPQVALPAYPSFSNWITEITGHAPHPDDYPPRQMLGRYLHQRFLALALAYPGAIAQHRQIATYAWRDAAGWWIETHTGQYGPYDEVVLSMGQPVTRTNPTLERWRAFAADCGATVASAYPGHVLQDKARDWTGKTVAIRGLGLAALDVVAVLTLGQGGALIKGRYRRSGREPASILPFSLDGLPPMPKPVAALEHRFELPDDMQASLRDALLRAVSRDPVAALVEITDALVTPGQYLSGTDPTDWLITERKEAGAQDAGRAPVTVLREGIEMACGRRPASVGYCIGQIWRNLQDELRSVFHTQNSNPETRAAILEFDRGLKRLSYGPPLQTARLLLALAEDGLLHLTLADDPAIKLSPKGWLLDNEAHAEVMIDAVLPSARLDRIEDPLIRSLERISMVRENPATGGIAVDHNGHAAQGLSVLGRVTEGCSIATDSIHDCYGDMTRGWARDLNSRDRSDAQGSGAFRD